MMLWRSSFLLAALAVTGAAAAPSFRLGIDYIEWGPFTLETATQIAADNAGELYIFTICSPVVDGPPCGTNITKLSADGKTILWQTDLGFTSQLAVGGDGGVYVVEAAEFNLVATKLSADGAGETWRAVIGPNLGSASKCSGLAVDSNGRAFVAVDSLNANGQPAGCAVVRLSAAGAIDATFPGAPQQTYRVAVDPSGADAVVAGVGFARLSQSGTWTAFTPQNPVYAVGLAVDANGDAVLSGQNGASLRSFLERVNPAGATVFSITNAGYGLALDAAGNAYVTGNSGGFLHPVLNTVAPCGSTWLSAYGPDGSLLQTTYAAGASLVAVTPDSTVFVWNSETSATPTQIGPFPQFPNNPIYGSAVLSRLSPHADAQVLPLACVGNAATLGTGPVAPGELVTLVGNGLGPQQGVEPQATLETPYPIEAANVEVTFDGIPAPLLWVQDSQINLVVPWSVTGSGTGSGPTTQVCVTYNNVQTNCLFWPVAQTAPGVFTVDGVHAAAVNQDGTINSATNPAPAGSLVSVWATGLGPITPPQADGTLVGFPLPTDVLQAAVGSITAIGIGGPFTIFTPFVMTYEGPAPYQVAGTSQINFKPASGSIYVEVGSTTSPAFQVYVAGGTSQ